MTIGGAVFIGIVAAPWALFAIEKVLSVPGGSLSPLLAAMVVAYALGEGLGRLACISYGCCFGKRLDRSGNLVRFLFGGIPAVFRGKTKKAAYDGNLEGIGLVPIQAITAVAYSAASVVSAYVFLCGRTGAAFMIAAAATLGWRPVSEFFRADYRGGGKISAYQWMSVIGAAYSTLLFFILPFPAAAGTDVLTGLLSLADWRILLLLEVCFLGLFVYSGLSTVTDSRIEFSVKPEFRRSAAEPVESSAPSS